MTENVARWGGKGANLIRLRDAGLAVPEFVVVPTQEYAEFVAHAGLDAVIVGGEAAPIRAAFENAAMTAAQRQRLLDRIGPLLSGPVAVRSSATAEDLPGLSFAGLQDTFLGVDGPQEALTAIVRCWSSAWTARAITYRNRHGMGHDTVAVAVVVQRMIPAEISGVLFTANPHTGRRDETVIDAAAGLGEALVSGQVVPDNYVLDTASGTVRERTLTGGRPLLSDAELRALTDLGRRVHLRQGVPQDIEWAITGGELWLLQARAITTLYPVPDTDDDADAWFSFGAVQGMLAPVTPLGQDVLRATMAGIGQLGGVAPRWRRSRMVRVAGDRLWIRCTPLLTAGRGRRLLRALPAADPAVAAILTRLASEPAYADPQGGLPTWRTLRALAHAAALLLPRIPRAFLAPAGARALVERTGAELVGRTGAALAEASVQSTPAARLTRRAAVLERAAGSFLPTMVPVFGPIMGLSVLLLHRLRTLARATGLPDAESLALSVLRSLPGNVTSEMDLRLADLAARLGADATTAALLREEDPAGLADRFVAGTLPPLAQREVRDFLDDYGMRGVGEIDLGVPRWDDAPEPVFASLAAYAGHGQDARAAYAAGADAAEEAVRRLAAAAAPLTALQIRFIARTLRGMFGARETPKFTIVRCLGLLRAALLTSGAELVAAGRLDHADDIFFLGLDELADAFEEDHRAAIRTRRDTWVAESRRTRIPRVLLADGRAIHEGLGGSGDLTGAGVSPGVAEGRVRVVLDPRSAQVEPGEILVCPGTDPAWTPLFLTAGGLITEVGGLMTHGSVLARECGIPAVVGVDAATTRLGDGQRIRLDGSSGAIELLDG